MEATASTEPCEPDAEVDSDTVSDSSILSVRHTSSRPMAVEMELNGRTVPMELDTGAAVSLMAQGTQRKFFTDEILEEADVRLSTYTSEPIPVLGVMNVRVKYASYSGIHPLYIVPGDGPTLLGRDWLQSIRLNWSDLRIANVLSSPLALKPLLQKYKEVFQKEVGNMRQFKAKLVVKAGTKPRFHRPRAVPCAFARSSRA